MAAVIPNNLSFTPLDVLTAAEMNALIENDNALAGFINALWQSIYPVGCYFETSDATFNPNISFGGTWVEDTAGRVLVAQDAGTFATVGDTGGEETHVLTVQEMPGHTHQIKTNNDDWNNSSGGGKFGTTHDGAAGWANNDWYTQPMGGNQAHNNLQPYLVVKRWHRIA